MGKKKMKIIKYFTFLVVLSTCVSAQTGIVTPKEIDKFIKPILPKGWKSIHDYRSLVIYREKEVRYLNPYSLPGGNLEDLFKEFGWDDHLLIKLHFVRKFEEKELKKVLSIRNEQLKKLKEKKNLSGKEKLGLKWKIEEKFLVPKFYNEKFSIFLHRTDRELFSIWPQTAEKEFIKVLKKLKEVIKEYDHNQKPD